MILASKINRGDENMAFLTVEYINLWGFSQYDFIKDM